MKYRREHLVGMPGQDGEAFRRGHIPQSDSAVTAGGGQEATIAAEGNGVDLARMTCQPGRSIACSRVPDVNLSTVSPRTRQQSPVRTVGQRLFLAVASGDPKRVGSLARRGICNPR